MVQMDGWKDENNRWMVGWVDEYKIISIQKAEWQKGYNMITKIDGWLLVGWMDRKNNEKTDG